MKLAVISRIIPCQESLTGPSAFLYRALAGRSEDISTDLFCWNRGMLSHRETVLAAEALGCGLTELPAYRWHIFHHSGSLHLRLPGKVREHISMTYDTIWIYGDELADLTGIFAGKKIIVTPLYGIGETSGELSRESLNPEYAEFFRLLKPVV